MINTCARSLQVCLILCGPMDCSPPGSSVQGILQARILEWKKKKKRILEWVAMPSSRGSSWPRDQTHDSYVSCLDKQVLYHWAAREALKWLKMTPKDWHVWLFKKISLTCYFSTCWRFPGWLGLFCFQISSWEKKILQFPLVALPRFWQSLLKSVTHEEIML